MADLKTHVKGAQTFLDKSDGRDKLLATVQYVAMFISAGDPGNAKKVQASVATARKVFRIMRPLESLAPLVHAPHLNAAKPLWVELLNKIKPVLMAVYFGGDNVVWASQAGLLQNKDTTRRAQRMSLYGWFGGSLCTLLLELYELQALTSTSHLKLKGETREEYLARQAQVKAEVRRRTTVFIHAACQALLAMGLLELRPWKPRTVGALGIAASLINCYMLYPSLPRPFFPWASKARAAASVDVPAPTVPAPPQLTHTKAS